MYTLWIFKRASNEYNLKIEAINERGAGIISKYKNLLKLQEKFENKYLKEKKYCKVRYHCHYTGEYREAMHGICNLKYGVPKIIPIAFHNGSNCDYYFIIKELAENFKK